MEDRLKETKRNWLGGVNNEKTFEKGGEKRGRRKSRRRTLLSYFGGEGGSCNSGRGGDDVNFEEKDGNGNESHLRDDGKGTDHLDHHHEMVEEYNYDGTHSLRYVDELQSIEKKKQNSVVMNDSKRQNEKESAAISMKEDDGLSLSLLTTTNNNLKGVNPPQPQEIIIEEGKGEGTMLDSSGAVDIVYEKSSDEICKQSLSMMISVPPNGVMVGQQTTRLAVAEVPRQNERGNEESDLKLKAAKKEEEYLLQHASNQFFLSVKQKKKLALLLDRQRLEADRLKTARSLASFKETYKHKNVAPLFVRRVRQPSIHKSIKRKTWTLLDFPTLIDNSIIPTPTSELQLQNQPETTTVHNDESSSSNLTRRRKRQQTPHLFQPHFDTDDFDVTTLLRGQHTSPSVAKDLFGGGSGDGDDMNNNNCCLRKTSNLIGKDSVMTLGMACGLSAESCESSMGRYEDMRRSSTADSLWTEVYRPQLTSDICGNSGCVKSLLDWLDQYKGRLMRRGSKLQPCRSAIVERAVRRGRSSSEESMAWSIDDDDDNKEDDCEIPAATLLVGPVGVGKTTTVYACAEAAGFTIIEVNASCSRSGTAIRKMFGEAAQSQRLGLPSSSRNRKTTSSQSPDIIDMTDNTTNDVTSVGHKRRKPKHHHNIKRKGDESQFLLCDGSVGSNNPHSGAAAVGATAASDYDNNGGESFSSSKSSSNVPKLTIILVEEIDVVTEEDAGFAGALKNLRADAKVPVIFTATSMAAVKYIIDRQVNVFQMEKAYICEVSHVIASIAYAERLAAIHVQACVNLAQYFHLDLRRCILALQGWGKGLMSACLAEDEGTGSIGGEAGAAWIAFDSIERIIDESNRFCQLLPVTGSMDIRYPRIIRLDPSTIPCGGSSSHRVIVNGSGFLHPPVGVGDDLRTTSYASPVSIIFGHERISCNLLSDSEIEVWIPPRSIPCGVHITVLIGGASDENAALGTMTFSKRQRNWMLRSDFEVLCYQRTPEQQQHRNELVQTEQKKSSKVEVNCKLSPPPKRKNRYIIDSDDVVDVTTTKTVAVDDECLKFSGVEKQPSIVVTTYDEDNNNDTKQLMKCSGSSICERQPLNNSENSRNNVNVKCAESRIVIVSDRNSDVEEEDNDGEEEEEFDDTASSSDTTTTIPPLSVISSSISNSSQQPQDVTDSKQQPCLVVNATTPLEQEQMKCTAPIKAESYSRPTRQQVDEFRLLGGELSECWNLADSLSFSDIVLAGCTPQEDGNNFRVMLPNPMRLRHEWDLSDAGEESCKDTTGRDYEGGGGGSPWPLVPPGPYIARDIWTLALKKSSPARKDKKRKVLDLTTALTEKKMMTSNIANKEGEIRVLPHQLQSQCLLGRSLWFRRNNKADYFWNAIERLKNRRLSYPLYLTPEDCTDLLPTLYFLSNCSMMFHRGVQLRHNTRSRAIREIEKVEAGEGAGNSYLLHSNAVQTVQDVQFLQGMYSQEAW
eukprot:373078_1